MRKLLLCVVVAAGLFSLTGCVVYEPRPRVYAVYDGPSVVVYHESYCGGYYYHRWR